MNLFKCFAATIVLVLMFSANLKAHVELDYPVGGETFVHNQTVTIQWHVAVPHPQLNWDLFYSVDGGVTWDTIQMNIPTDVLSYSWVVPAIETNQARIRIFQDNEDQDYLDISMDFSLVPSTMAPVLDAPAQDLMLNCSDDIDAHILSWLSDFGGAEATTFCGNLVWSHDYNGLSNGCANTGSALVTFIAQDDCGLITTNAEIIVQDTNPPAIDAHAVDMTVECNGNLNVVEFQSWLYDYGGASAHDECSNVSWYVDIMPPDILCEGAKSTSVRFVVTDACGNSAETTANFIVEDNLPPMILQPAEDTTIACDEHNQDVVIMEWLSRHGGASMDDICGEIVWTNNFLSAPDTCEANWSTLVTFTATDPCGNFSESSATLTILGASATLSERERDDIRMYPNPANDILTIELETLTKHQLFLMDIFGRTIWSVSSASGTNLIPVDQLMPGIYVVLVKGDDTVTGIPVVIE